MTECVFRRATAEDAAKFYGGLPPLSFRGWIAEMRGEIVAIGGMYYDNGNPIAFSEITDEFRKDKRRIVKGMRLLMAMYEAQPGPVFAVPDPKEPTSEKLLARLGWEPTGWRSPIGEILRRG